MGWNDEGAAGLMSLGDRLGLLKPKDPDGIPREYAAGSQYQDNVQSLRGDDSAAKQANPGAYTGGALAGSVPSALASAGLGGGSAAARLATSGLTGGTLGAVSGAGHADRGDTFRGATEGAALGGAMGAAGGALAEEVPIINQFLKTRQAYAPANAAGQASAAVAPNLKRTSALGDTAPPRQAMLPSTAPSDSILPPIPKAARTGIREADLAPMEDLANASYAAQGAKNLGKSVSPEARALGQAANEQLGNFTPSAKVAKAPKELEKFSQPESATAKTARPPKGARAKRPAEVARKGSVAQDVQQELPFPERAPRDRHFEAEPEVGPSQSQRLHDGDGANDFDEQLDLLRHSAKKSLETEPVQLALPRVEDRVSPKVLDAHNDTVAADIERLPEDLKNARFDWMGNGYEDIRAGTAGDMRSDALNKLLNATERESAGPLYRGVRLSPEQAEKFRRTGTFPADARPSSWAVDPNDARNFARPNHSDEVGFVMRQKGATGSPMSASESEFVTKGHPEFKASRWTKEGPDADEPYMVDVEPHTPVPEQVQTPADPRQMTWADWMKRR